MINLKITFNDIFYNTDYASDNAASSGRMETIIDTLRQDNSFTIIQSGKADLFDIQKVHTQSHIDHIKNNTNAYNTALFAAGAAINSAEISYLSQPAFACVRPPGHHANKNFSWGHCFFNNSAISLVKLRDSGRINSAFIIDVDAHTGDGTIDCLSDWKEVYILNPMADNREEYLMLVDNYIKELPKVDIVLICAGFDSYIKDVGHKLITFDYYMIAKKMQLLAKKMEHNRRYGILEGGYYLPDLGKNVLALCQGLQG